MPDGGVPQEGGIMARTMGGNPVFIRKGVYGSVHLDGEGVKFYVQLFDTDGKDIATTPLCDSKPEAIEVAKVLARQHTKK